MRPGDHALRRAPDRHRVAEVVTRGMALTAVVLCLAPGGASAQVVPKVLISPQLCGPLHHNFGPYDYRTDRNHLPVVENYHFRPEMEALSPSAKGELGAQFNYTLHAFPNHHRALAAMVRLGDRQKTNQPRKATYTVECYFERAIRFRPDDVVVRMLFADYLAKRKEPEMALEQLRVAAGAAGDNPFTHYNLGLVYLSLDRAQDAAGHARKALQLGLTRTELIDRLRAAGAWDDAAAPAPTSASAASAP